MGLMEEQPSNRNKQWSFISKVLKIEKPLNMDWKKEINTTHQMGQAPFLLPAEIKRVA